MRVSGSITPPGDKSVTHRALIVAALARTRVEIAGALSAQDARSTAAALRRMGVKVGRLRRGASAVLEGARWQSPDGSLHCGNAGTTARLLLGALAGQDVTARLTGDASLRRRPMRRVTTPLRAMGAHVEEERGDGLPLTIRGGTLRSITYHTPVASAQIKSALLLAGLSGGVAVSVSEPARSRDHTERMFEHLGFRLRSAGTTVHFEGPARKWPNVEPFRLDVPGDASSAAFLVAAAVLAEGGELRVSGVGVNPTRVGYLQVLARMGVAVQRLEPRVVCGEPVADLLVRPSPLRGVTIAAAEVPSLIDEIPVLAVLASRAEGESRFRSVGELRVKESDRLGLLASNLRAVGGEAEVQGEDLVVAGRDQPPRGRVETAGDHRIAMAFAVLGMLPGANIELSETSSPEISYPGFFDDLRSISHG